MHLVTCLHPRLPTDSAEEPEKLMRITFILPHAGLAGGIRVVAIYADRLQKRGHKVTVVSLPRSPFPLKHKLKILFCRGMWPPREKEPSHFDGLNIDHRVLKQYRPVTNEDVPDADVVIATWWETAEWVNRMQPSKGEKIYFVQHHEVFDHLPIERARETYRLPFRKIAVSQWLVDILTQEYGTRDTHLVPNSVDFDFFNASQRGRQDRPTIGFMYSPVPFKGCNLSIAVLHQIQRVVPGLRIQAFGSSQPSEGLPLPEETEFFYRPSQNKIREIYSSCDFWLFSSRVEGFGLPILEAMACRTPVIATRAGAAPELVGKGGGFLLDDWSVERMSDTIVNALSMTPEDWGAMSCRAREIVTEYSWDDATILFEKALAS